ncbi:MAG: DNA polymerase III subunit gamma/tau, partial [Acidimicrobiales bacterium]
MAYQSLYRRYRPRTFAELVGQQHVVTALRNAITEDRVGHAYLFSGPRGTGKTSTARILGKALNCTDLGADGEPCCACESCLAFEAGTSYDLHELDAASNNGVEAIRDLISKVALASPGRTKVYILDEVHMLTAGAENALLKTLEEPPDHVVFVLATTEPHKVVPTIRSRTQHYEFELIPADQLGAHVRFVAADAGLDIDDARVDHVLRVGGGSARDTLSALDQVVAAGGIPSDLDAIETVLRAVAATDPAGVIAAVGEALTSGLDPRVIGENLLGRLRDAFLSAMGAPLDHLSAGQAVAAQEVAQEMGPANITRALELLGTALIEMRQAPDPRIDLEVALLRLTRADLDTDLSAVVARLERLERAGPVQQPAVPVASGSRPADGARAALAEGPTAAPIQPATPEYP